MSGVHKGKDVRTGAHPREGKVNGAHVGAGRVGDVHVGNVVEFHDAMLPEGVPDDVRADVAAGDLGYACLAPFHSPDPGLVLVPEFDGEPWWERQVALLGWDRFEPVTVPGPLGPGFAALGADPVLSARVRAAVDAGARLIPWGESAPYREYARDLPEAAAVRSTDAALPAFAESKASSPELFAKAHNALDSPDGIHLTGERLCESEPDLVATLVDAGARGRTVVLKAPFGVGGYGTAVLSPHRTSTRRAVLETLARLREDDTFHNGLPTIVQDYQWRSDLPWSDVSGDCTIDHLGRVRLEGVTAMAMNGTQFAGGVTDDGVVIAPARSALLSAFCVAVGEQLALVGYRGWFDIDFLVRPTGELVPLEINARRTGTTAPLSVQTCLRARRGRDVTVISRDVIALPSRHASRPAFARFARAVELAGLAADVVPTLVAGTDAALPHLGVVVAADDAADAVRKLAHCVDALVTEFRS
ncbi:hypothetical protein V5P93_004238 [Actinokineospora auranticolor]|nr:hypothetical protein [Actinokineospora auranticolor]